MNRINQESLEIFRGNTKLRLIYAEDIYMVNIPEALQTYKIFTWYCFIEFKHVLINCKSLDKIWQYISAFCGTSGTLLPYFSNSCPCSMKFKWHAFMKQTQSMLSSFRKSRTFYYMHALRRTSLDERPVLSVLVAFLRLFHYEYLIWTLVSQFINFLLHFLSAVFKILKHF